MNKQKYSNQNVPTMIQTVSPPEAFGTRSSTTSGVIVVETTLRNSDKESNEQWYKLLHKYAMPANHFSLSPRSTNTYATEAGYSIIARATKLRTAIQYVIRISVDPKELQNQGSCIFPGWVSIRPWTGKKETTQNYYTENMNPAGIKMRRPSNKHSHRMTIWIIKV